MQNFMLERLLERISLSKYQQNFILKSGFLIAAMVGLDTRTTMAEKLETVISRGDQNTRPRDYYDIYILAKLQYPNIEPDSLKATLSATTDKRGSKEVVKNYRRIMDTVKNSVIMQK